MQKFLRVLLFLIGAGSVGLYIYKGATEGDFDAWQQALAGLAALLGSLSGDGEKKAAQAQATTPGAPPPAAAPAFNGFLLTFGKIFLILGVVLMVFDSGTAFLLLFLGGGALLLEFIVRQIAPAISNHAQLPFASTGNRSPATTLMVVGLVLTCTGYGAIIGIPMGIYGLWLYAQAQSTPGPGTNSFSGVYLEIVNPGSVERLKGHKLPLQHLTTIGRTDASDITIPDELISQRHAQLRWDGRTWLIEDLDSTNGTCLNGNPVKAATPVRFTDLIQLGGRVYVRLTR